MPETPRNNQHGKHDLERSAAKTNKHADQLFVCLRRYFCESVPCSNGSFAYTFSAVKHLG